MLNEMRPDLLKGKAEQDFMAVTVTVHWIEFLDGHNRGAYPENRSLSRT
jgi:hypothetical protein